jgi:hypothetical protein
MKLLAKVEGAMGKKSVSQPSEADIEEEDSGDLFSL